MNSEPIKIAIKEKKGPVPIVAVGYRTVPSTHPDSLYLQMLGSILGGGESSRLYKRLVLEDECAMIALGGAMGLEKEGMFGAGARLPQSKSSVRSTRRATSVWKRIPR